MSKKKDGKKKAAEMAREKLSAKDYDRELEKLHVELVKLQEWVVAKGLKVAKGAKVVAAVTFADQKSVTVRFTLK